MKASSANILVLNCGSSSLKYRVIRMPDATELAGGEAQRVGPRTAEPSKIFHNYQGKRTVVEVPMATHGEAFQEILKILNATPGLAPDAAGHRVVHGADVFASSAEMTPENIAKLESLNDLAPLHNPPALSLIKACAKLRPDMPQIAIFDTAFHSTIPPKAYTYAISPKVAQKLKIRKYGFHGTSHKFVAAECAKLLGIPDEKLNAISCHLGSGGASICAIRNGKSVDNTMGFSPLQGLIMSTRSGDLDPALALKLISFAGSSDKAESILNKKSGVLALSGGVSGDIRDMLSGAALSKLTRQQVQNAIDTYLWRTRKYLGSYIVSTGRPQALIFTDTIGETVPEVRWSLCSGLEFLGLRIDAAKNASAKLPAIISTDDSPVTIFAIATNEELEIARQAWSLMSGAAA
jgi:acetate kinase